MADISDLYKMLFDSEAGKLVMADLEQQCFFNETTATLETHFMFVNEGRRQIVLHIKDMLKPKPINDETEKDDSEYE